jgi:hypothetical protein
MVNFSSFSLTSLTRSVSLLFSNTLQLEEVSALRLIGVLIGIGWMVTDVWLSIGSINYRLNYMKLPESKIATTIIFVIIFYFSILICWQK